MYSKFSCWTSPEIFKDPSNKSRLYSYKFDEYQKSTKVLEDDFINCKLEFRKREFENNIKNRMSALKLKWTTFDSLFDSLPESDISHEIKKFEEKYNKAK